MEMIVEWARNQRGRAAVVSPQTDFLPVGDKSRTHKRGTTRELPRQTWPSHQNAPRLKQSRQKRCKTLSLKSLHLTAARTEDTT